RIPARRATRCNSAEPLLRDVTPASLHLRNRPNCASGHHARAVRSHVPQPRGVPMSASDEQATFGHGEVFDAVSGYLGSQLETFEESVQDFQDSSQEWRRLFSELLGTFFLVLVASGGGVL